MDTFLQEYKLAVLGILMAVFLSLVWVANHYHEAYIKERVANGSLRLQLSQANSVVDHQVEAFKKIAEAEETRQKMVLEEIAKRQGIIDKLKKDAEGYLGRGPGSTDKAVNCEEAKELFLEFSRKRNE